MATNKMLIDAAHPEETRVVMVRGNRVDEFDFESEHKTQLRGNIYLAKVTRVEPSLQAAFVDYGGNRHGFLAFSEIHPDYYQIPVADRQALLDAEAEDARAQAREDDDEDEDVVASPEPSEEADSKPTRKRRSRRRNNKKTTADTAAGGAVDAGDSGDLTAAEQETSDSPEQTDVTSEDLTSPDTSIVNEDPGEESDDPTTMAADNDSDDVVSEPADKSESVDKAPAAKPRRRTSRVKKAKEEAPIEASETAEAPDQAEVAITEETDAEPPKPKRRATRRKPKAKIEADAVAEDQSASDAKSEVSAEPVIEPETIQTEETDEAAKPKKRTRSRSRKKPKQDESETASEEDGESVTVEDVGADNALEEVPTRRAPRRHYKIQEVIKRRQILLVQVVKEERGNKGAALTTYLSLAGRYSVLMPNTARGGGISRKITDSSDRKRLKSIAGGLDVPQGMGVILRTAGASRTKPEIERDFEYLMRLWENVRTLTLSSTAPCLVYEEGSLIKRSIRDLFDKDTSEITVAGDAGYKEARDFMTMLMPDSAKRVKQYRDRVPMFARLGVDSQLDAMMQPQVTLKSGGYLVINQTEALVAIDVNSGRSTRQHSIEETAHQTNLEAADEVARQLRLRDLAGLIVVDFIDMEDKRNNRSVEKRLKDALKRDRARIQVGRISHFGLLEMSRQRIRASVLESTTQVCPTCEGMGHVRSSSSVVLQVLRSIEEQLNKSSRNNLIVKTLPDTALYILNHKRESLSDLEARFGVSINIEMDASLGTIGSQIERGDTARRREGVETAVQPDTIAPDITSASEDNDDQAPDASEEGSGNKKRRRRRRRGRGGDEAENDNGSANETAETPLEAISDSTADTAPNGVEAESSTDQPPRKRRSRRKKTDDDNTATAVEEVEAVVAESEEEKPKRTRRPRSAKKVKEAPVDPESEDSLDDVPALASVDVSEETPVKKRRTTRRKKEEAGTDAMSDTMAATAATEFVSSSAEEANSETESPEDGKKRGGWWQRKFF